MAITETMPNTNPMNLTLFQHAFQSLAVQPPTVRTTGDFCWCRYVCDSYLPVFAGDNDLKNDQTDFPFSRLSSADTIVIKLYLEGALVATLTDSTYGTFYDFGSLNNADIKGILLDWGLVHTAFGSGHYQIIAEKTILSVTSTEESSTFYLLPYSEGAAHGTVRIESTHNGTVENSAIDYSGCNWYAQIRIRGYFGNKQPTFVTDNYLGSDRERKQIQDSISNSYDLEILGMTTAEKDRFINETLLANTLTLTDYSVHNDDRYLPIDVYPESIEKLKYNEDRPGSHAQIKFKEKKENTIKRNSSFI